MTRGYTRGELHLDGTVLWVPGVSDRQDHCIVVGVDDTGHSGKHIIKARACGTSVIVPHQAHNQLPNCKKCQQWDRARWRALSTPSIRDISWRVLRG